MIDTETQERANRKDADFRAQLRRLNSVILAVLVAILVVPGLATWWISRQLPVVSTVSIDNMQLLSAPLVCPGDAVVVEYDFHAQGAGVLVRDWTAWFVEPPKTIIFSTSRRFILDGPIDQHLTETWHIPHTYLNPETEQDEPLPAGQYRRYLAISSPSRSTVIAIASVAFELRSDCE